MGFEMLDKPCSGCPDTLRQEAQRAHDEADRLAADRPFVATVLRELASVKDNRAKALKKRNTAALQRRTAPVFFLGRFFFCAVFV